MTKKIERLQWKPMWASHIGCMKGCLEYLGSDISDAWLFGGTGHAFIINIHEIVCPSGPTAWDTEKLVELGRNIGCDQRLVFGHKIEDDFKEKQRAAWEMVQEAIGKGLPCYGWELGNTPEFYVINGCDDENYYYSGVESGKKPWEEVGQTQIGVLEMYRVQPYQTAEVASTIKAALDFALEHSRSPEKWIFPKYRAGPAGFDAWISAVDVGKADGFGMAYNAAEWAECRGFAVEFLKEAKERLGADGSLFDEAVQHYEVVAKNLKELSKLFPFPPKGGEVNDKERCRSAVQYLKEAKVAEERGLGSLERIVNSI